MNSEESQSVVGNGADGTEVAATINVDATGNGLKRKVDDTVADREGDETVDAAVKKFVNGSETNVTLPSTAGPIVVKNEIMDTESVVEPKTEIMDADGEQQVTDPKSVPAAVKSKLPDLEKYWKTVREDPTDFTGWTLLLQYVDQESDIEAAREAYDAFLAHYPYCYGYWRKYADYENRKGNKTKCDEVFERGLKAIPLSVDLWLHFLTYARNNQGEEAIRAHYERAIQACGLEFRSDRLWDGYIKWEIENRNFRKVIELYDRLIRTPTQGYSGHFDNFSSFVQSHDINDYTSSDEVQKLLREVRIEKLIADHKNDEAVLTEDQIKAKLPDGPITDEEKNSIKDKVVSLRKPLRKSTAAEVTERWNFEEGIKRPYFHVKALEKCQLQNWKEYLDFEIARNNKERIIVLFERCLIACALYEEFWLKYLFYLEKANETDRIRDVYERACEIHHKRKPNLHLKWALFEECEGRVQRAAEILANLDRAVPNILQVAYRRINLERRCGNYEQSCSLFDAYIADFNEQKKPEIAGNLAIKYARFVLKIFKTLDRAIAILNAAVERDPANPRLYLQLIDLFMHRDQLDEREVIELFNRFLANADVDCEQKALFAQRKLEFLEDFGADIQSVRQAYDEYQTCCKAYKEMKRKRDEKNESTSKKLKTGTIASLGGHASTITSLAAGFQSGANGAYGPYPNQYGAGYGASGATAGSAAADPYQYQNWQYSQAGYSGAYNQWGGYSYY